MNTKMFVMEKEDRFGPMVQCMKDGGKITKQMERED